jgi:uncharacterized membrane-anchored protein
MKPLFSRIAIASAAVLVLGAVNLSIIAKENIKTQGQRIYLRLAPVDPRSLMQGDYMALRFEIASQISSESSGSAGLSIAPNGVATLNPDLNAPGLRIRYRIRNGQVWLGTNAYFFEDGASERYRGATYGEFRVDPDSGDAVLIALTGDDLRAK